MSFTSWMSFLGALLVSYTVLRSGLGKLTSQVTDEVQERYLVRENPVQENETRSAYSFTSVSPGTMKEVRAVIDLICGVLLLVPSWRRIGAAIALALLAIGLIRCLRNGNSLVPPLTMMTLSALVWFL